NVEQKTLRLLRAIKQFTSSTGDEAELARAIRQELAAALQLPIAQTLAPWSAFAEEEGLVEYLKTNLGLDPALWGTIFGWVFVHELGKIQHELTGQLSRSWMDEWLLDRLLGAALKDFGLDEAEVRQSVAVIKILTSHQRWHVPEGSEKLQAYRVLETLLKD